MGRSNFSLNSVGINKKTTDSILFFHGIFCIFFIVACVRFFIALLHQWFSSWTDYWGVIFYITCITLNILSMKISKISISTRNICITTIYSIFNSSTPYIWILQNKGKSNIGVPICMKARLRIRNNLMRHGGVTLLNWLASTLSQSR